MQMCRTCLRTPAYKDISELANGINGNKKKYPDIMKFCLDIEVAQDSKITTNLCDGCFRKIILFHKFKAASLENDAYLKSLNPVAQLIDQKLTVYVDGNRTKHTHSEEFDSHFGEYDNYEEEIKVEIELIRDIDSEIKLESPVEEVKHEYIEENIKIEKVAPTCKEQAPRKKEKNPQGVKQANSRNVGPERKMCEECGMSVKNLAHHSIRHQSKDDRQTLRCKACPKLFCTEDGLLRHYKTSHLGIRATCDICFKEYTTTGLAAHKLRKHNRSALRFECSVCARRWPSKTQLDAHMNTHIKARPFQCDICHKTYGNKTRITTHIRQVHLNEKNYHCERCPKGFFDKQALKEHLRTHTKELLFKCEDCEKSFWTKNSLRIHRVAHSGVKNHHCELCGRSFLRRGSLKAHMLTHTKEKPSPCRYCDARFRSSTHRNRHERSLHKKQLSND